MSKFDDYMDAEITRLLDGIHPRVGFRFTAEHACRIDALENLLRHAVESGQIILPPQE